MRWQTDDESGGAYYLVRNVATATRDPTLQLRTIPGVTAPDMQGSSSSF